MKVFGVNIRMNSLVLSKCCCVSQQQDTQRGLSNILDAQSRIVLQIFLFKLEGGPYIH